MANFKDKLVELPVFKGLNKQGYGVDDVVGLHDQFGEGKVFPSYRKIRRRAKKSGVWKLMKENRVRTYIAKRLNERGENDYQPVIY